MVRRDFLVYCCGGLALLLLPMAGFSDEKPLCVVLENRKSAAVLCAPGDRVGQENFGRKPSQLWFLHPLGEGVYQIESYRNKQVLQASGNENGNVVRLGDQYSEIDLGTACLVHAPDGRDYYKHDLSRWEIVELKNGFFHIKNKASGKLLDVEAPKVDSNDAKIQLWDFNTANDAHQQFRIRVVELD